MPDDDRASELTSPERSADDVWLATLAGRAPDHVDMAHAGAAREALLLRQALREWTPAVDPVAGDDAADVRWVPLDDVGSWPPVVGGLIDFLVDHDIVGD